MFPCVVDAFIWNITWGAPLDQPVRFISKSEMSTPLKPTSFVCCNVYSCVYVLSVDLPLSIGFTDTNQSHTKSHANLVCSFYLSGTVIPFSLLFISTLFDFVLLSPELVPLLSCLFFFTTYGTNVRMG